MAQITSNKQLQPVYQGAIAVGIPCPWPINKTIPAGFLQLNGSSYDASYYSELYAILGSSTLPNYPSTVDTIWIIKAKEMSVGEVINATTLNMQPPSHYERTHKNYIVNGDFSVWQRGTSQTSSGYGSVDRWLWTGNNIATISRQDFTLGQTDVPNEPKHFLRLAVTSNSQYHELEQKIEDVRTLAGKTVTLSFYAKGTIGFGVRLIQNFGTGGSPSNIVIAIASQQTISPIWKRYSITGTLPSIAGKTFGTNNNSHLWVSFQITDTTTGTFDIAMVQLEEGAVATDFEVVDPALQLMRCQRYYTEGCFSSIAFITMAVVINIHFPVEMRTNPTVTISNVRGGANNLLRNASNGSLVTITNGSFYIQDTKGLYGLNNTSAVFTVGNSYDGYVTADAEL